MQASRSSKLRTRRNCCLSKGDQCTNCSARQPKRTYPRCAVLCRALTLRLSLSALGPRNCHVHCGYSPSVLLYCFCFSGKRRFKFGRRGSPCVALRPALELDIWGENLNGAIFPPNDQTCDPHILALYRAFFLDPVNYLRTVPTSEARIAYQISGDLASAASDASAPKISRN